MRIFMWKFATLNLNKYFGVQIDNSLNCKEQKTVSIKVSRAIGFLKDAKTILPWRTLKNLCKSIFETQCYQRNNLTLFAFAGTEGIVNRVITKCSLTFTL